MWQIDTSFYVVHVIGVDDIFDEKIITDCGNKIGLQDSPQELQHLDTCIGKVLISIISHSINVNDQ